MLVCCQYLPLCSDTVHPLTHCESLRKDSSVKPLCITEKRGEEEERWAFGLACSCMVEVLIPREPVVNSAQTDHFSSQVQRANYKAAYSAEMSWTEKSLTLYCSEKNKTKQNGGLLYSNICAPVWWAVLEIFSLDNMLHSVQSHLKGISKTDVQHVIFWCMAYEYLCSK